MYQGYHANKNSQIGSEQYVGGALTAGSLRALL